MILTVNLWKSTQTNATANATFDPSRELVEIYKCIELIRNYELKHTNAGRLIDIINTVISVSHYTNSVPSSQNADSLNTGMPPSVTQLSQNSVETNEGQHQELSSFHLPLYTDELGSFDSSPYMTTSFCDFTPAVGQTRRVPV
ncbi:hypothetical protein K435DRAFT_59303 [Dendrothele bispora CBS 962.96]|uniref:Uncharacterized protein n=1 Tax=Dendrothele bispora (strain CBS 962.96) TaxID=1314807 RepID=A0A4V4HB83_DENBC|nr:hypothetical protein K435DRAFT_59303 [Dendrothele bispora CBS 962.96]